MLYDKLMEIIVNKPEDMPGFNEKFKKAVNGLEKNAANREKSILEDASEVYVKYQVSPQDYYLTANVYDSEGDGFQFMIEHRDHEQKRSFHKPGDITG